MALRVLDRPVRDYRCKALIEWGVIPIERHHYRSPQPSHEISCLTHIGGGRFLDQDREFSHGKTLQNRTDRLLRQRDNIRVD